MPMCSSYHRKVLAAYVCTDFYSNSEQLPLSETKKAKTKDDINGKTIIIIVSCMC